MSKYLIYFKVFEHENQNLVMQKFCNLKILTLHHSRFKVT